MKAERIIELQDPEIAKDATLSEQAEAYQLMTEAVYRQEAKIPIYFESYDDDAGKCPSCGVYVDCVEKYCNKCGQKLDWVTDSISSRWKRKQEAEGLNAD